MNRINRTALKISILATALSGLSFVTACTVRTPTTETPIPNDRGIEKTFFEERVTSVSANGKTETKIKHKTFLCGWAPISEAGRYGSTVLLHGVERAGHCNMEFEITANALVGRLINPSFPDDRKTWKTAITIPIRKHYYYERAKDSYGRETNEFIENTSRSEELARPMMHLDLEGISFENWDVAVFSPFFGSGTGHVLNIEDVEWDKASGFLGFTANVVSQRFGSDISARIRFNFKTFEHSEKFEKTPYNALNARYFNALHVVGQNIDGSNQIWSAAKWDLSKTHDVYMYGFPDAYVPIAQKVVDQWNAAFKAIGHKGGFQLNHKKMKHPYDLRYPMMVWVDDPTISEVSPLGIGMALADVRNGEIKWGQITLYGGMLERYVKNNLNPGSSDSGTSAKGRGAAGALEAPGFFKTYFNPTATLLPPPMLDAAALQRFEAHVEKYAEPIDQAGIIRNKMREMSQRLGRDLKAEEIEIAKDEASRDAGRMRTARVQQLQSVLAKQLPKTIRLLESRRQTADGIRKESRQLFGFAAESSTEMRERTFGKDEARLSDREKLKMIASASAKFTKSIPTGVIHDTDRLLIDVGPTLVSSLAKTGTSYEDGLHNVIHELILHEFGHMIGLGHQFKENILPEDGTVPEKYLTALKADLKKGFTNSTSAMGYKSPVTEVLEDPEKIGPGPQDILTLRYLYNQEYATYRKGDADFKFEKVPASGLIPTRNPDAPQFVTSYFPQCNDFDASYSSDPYCNRFDRGHDAKTIVKDYFEDLNANMASRIFPFTDSRGTNTEAAETYLWWKSLSTLGRVRTFYDHMRQKYETEIRSIAKSERDLYEFSRVCAGELPGSKQLQDIFAANPDFKELCQVNRMAIKEMMNLLVLPGPDRSRMDWSNANVAAGQTGGDGDTNYGRAFGTHTALSVLPLKLSAINALTSPYPHTVLGTWESFWTTPIPRYAGSDGLFSYSSLYPFEFTEAVAGTVEKNLKFNSASSESPRMGLPIMSLGYFIDQQTYGNDSTRMPKDFIESIRNQTNFRLSMKAILLDLKTREDASRVTHFEGDLYDPYTDKSQRLSEVFILPGDKLIVRANTRNFVYPITTIMFLNDKTAYAWAYHIEYEDKHDDVLAAHSAKAKLEKLNNTILDACIRGSGTAGSTDGLASFFNSQQRPETFPGFLVLSGIANDEARQLSFSNSVNDNFEKFRSLNKADFNEKLMPIRCEKAISGIGMIISTAAVINGYFPSEVLEYLEK